MIPLTRDVKLADIEDNIDPARLALLDGATVARLREKYRFALIALGVCLMGSAAPVSPRNSC